MPNKTILRGDVNLNTISTNGTVEIENNDGSLSATQDVGLRVERKDGTYGPRLEIRHSTNGTDLHHTYSTNASNMTFSIGGSEKMKLSSGGLLTVHNNLSVPNGGIFLGGTSGNNHLDDYEEGTFYINLIEENTNDMYGLRFLYVKVGRLVHIGQDGSYANQYFIMDHSNRVTGNDLSFSGSLPFTPAHGGMIPAFGNRGIRQRGNQINANNTIPGIGFRRNSKTCYLSTAWTQWAYQAANDAEREGTITNLTFLPNGTYYTNE